LARKTNDAAKHLSKKIAAVLGCMKKRRKTGGIRAFDVKASPSQRLA
jgi:hypothetical protein